MKRSFSDMESSTETVVSTSSAGATEGIFIHKRDEVPNSYFIPTKLVKTYEDFRKVTCEIFNNVGEPTLYYKDGIVHKSVFGDSLFAGKTYAISFAQISLSSGQSGLSIHVVFPCPFNKWARPPVKYQMDRGSLVRDLRYTIWVDMHSDSPERFHKLMLAVPRGTEDQVRRGDKLMEALMHNNAQVGEYIWEAGNRLLVKVT
ncbi:MAG: hypothetical protein M1812_005981 [Candelaria pacifica]|nr:MAG: hypothetical protein M1812_005981 [Candelaria pacifica]